MYTTLGMVEEQGVYIEEGTLPGNVQQGGLEFNGQRFRQSLGFPHPTKLRDVSIEASFFFIHLALDSSFMDHRDQFQATRTGHSQVHVN